MPRQSRIVIPDMPHHVTQRGNYRQDIFESDSDYEKYSLWFNEYAAKYKLGVLAYCLMSNHVHFIVVPSKEETLARVFNTTHMRYAQYVNKKLKATGHLWQGRFFSCVLDDKHLYRAIRYVENNPVRIKVVKKAWLYRWSSAGLHASEGQHGPIKLNAIPDWMPAEEWKDYLSETDEDMCKEMRLKTSRGLVVGEDGFIQKLEKRLDRSLGCLNPGRPIKKK